MKTKLLYLIGLLIPAVLSLVQTNNTTGSLSSLESSVVRIDYLYPGESPHWLGVVGPTPKWVDVPLPDNRVTVHELRILTGGHTWTMELCQSKSDPSTCMTPIPDEVKNRWTGDFTLVGSDISYEDEDDNHEMHFYVESLNGDWMTFRVIMTVDVE